MLKKSLFGKLKSGEEVFQFMLNNKSGTQINIINYGAIVKNIFIKNKNGKFEDIVLGYDSLEGYVNDRAYFGAIVGRYGNRIAKGKFHINGKLYQLNTNDGENHLHGGNKGFNKVIWKAQEYNESSIRLFYQSPEGEEGYPGTLKLEAEYSLTEDDELIINYTGETDKATILNPTHHSYFNLSGDFQKDILDHEIKINADNFTPVKQDAIPIGEITSVIDTPFDFRVLKKIGQNINDDNEQLKYGRGYDHNFVLNNYDHSTRKAAEIYEQTSGRFLQVFTDQPGLQFYTGNFLDGTIEGKNGISFKHRTGLCFEAQHYPDSPNNPSFPSVILNPGDIYKQETIYKFSIR